jgi:hypothetical protein
MSTPVLPTPEATEKARQEAEDYMFRGIKKLVVVSHGKFSSRRQTRQREGLLEREILTG